MQHQTFEKNSITVQVINQFIQNTFMDHYATNSTGQNGQSDEELHAQAM